MQLCIHNIKTNKQQLGHYLHEDFANNNVIVILEDCAKYNCDTIISCLNISKNKNQGKCRVNETLRSQMQSQ